MEKEDFASGGTCFYLGVCNEIFLNTSLVCSLDKMSSIFFLLFSVSEALLRSAVIFFLVLVSKAIFCLVVIYSFVLVSEALLRSAVICYFNIRKNCYK